MQHSFDEALGHIINGQTDKAVKVIEAIIKDPADLKTFQKIQKLCRSPLISTKLKE